VAALYDITDWNAQPWYNTGGTRAKKYVQSPNGEYYYFKRSQLKPGKDYKFEFWSEIIACEVGSSLGFNVLLYDIATDGDIMGCISASIINPDKEELVEGVKYLQAHDNTFAPEDRSLRKLYTFQLIERALADFGLNKFIDQFIEIIVFDALIGNGDRHQENWAFINEYSSISRWAAQFHEKSIPDLSRLLINLRTPKSLAPIYDNGSSLGRELSEEKVIQLLEDEVQLKRYINKGSSEIHWNNRKISHFDLIGQLSNSPYREMAKTVLERVGVRFSKTNIASIVSEIDNLVPESHAHYKIPFLRKQLIIRLICLRAEKLSTLLHERV
jgi:hypothetical protein